MTENTKLVVYTALFGNYDKLRDPKRKYSGCEFVCFTDQKDLKSDVWEIRQVENGELPPAMMNRHYKFFPHLYFPEYEYSLYVDANIEIIGAPNQLVNKYLDNYLISCPKHFLRDCLYEEAQYCILEKKATEHDVFALLGKYRSENFPKNYGLAENNIIYRKHNDPMIMKMMNEWWDLITSGPKRDQLSLMYLSWKMNIKVALMMETSRNSNKIFRYCLHQDNKYSNKIVFFIDYIRANQCRNLFFNKTYIGLVNIKKTLKYISFF